MGSRVGTALACSTFFSRSRAKAEQRYGVQIKTIVIQEAGLDGFWIYRLLLAEGIESHVVDAASIAVARLDPAGQDRFRSTARSCLDADGLARGERRVCSWSACRARKKRIAGRPDARARQDAAQGTHSAYQSGEGPAQRPGRPGLQSASGATVSDDGSAATEHGQCERVRDVRDVLCTLLALCGTPSSSLHGRRRWSLADK